LAIIVAVAVTLLVSPLGHAYRQVDCALPLVDEETSLNVPDPLKLSDQPVNSYQLLPPPEDSGAVAPMVCDCPLGTKTVPDGFTFTFATPCGLLCPPTVRKHP
jgi:hypothetical protein